MQKFELGNLPAYEEQDFFEDDEFRTYQEEASKYTWQAGLILLVLWRISAGAGAFIAVWMWWR